MINKVLSITLISLFAICNIAMLSNLAVVKASSVSNGLNEACAADNSNPYCVGQGQTNDPVANTIKNVTTIVAVVGGIVAVIFIMISGLRYITSSGDPQKTKSARNTLIYALAGLAVIAVAQAIILLVLSRLKN